MNTESNETASNKLETLLISEINTSDEIQHRFIFETIIQFDKNFRVTTVNLWNSHKDKIKQNQLANNIKAKMDAFRTSKATEATAEAITKATTSFSDAQTQNLQTKLCVSNLEKSFLKQEQKTNELLNIIKNNNNKNTQKKHKRKLQTGASNLSQQRNSSRINQKDNISNYGRPHGRRLGKQLPTNPNFKENPHNKSQNTSKAATRINNAPQLSWKSYPQSLPKTHDLMEAFGD
jgi:hypothetical protein